MLIGLFLNKTNSNTHTIGVNGEEIWARALCKGLNVIEGVEARCYGENMGFMPEVDIAIYFQLDMVKPDTKLLGRQKNVAIMQNFTVEEDKQAEKNAPYFNFDGKVFTTSKLFSLKYNWELLYPCVDIDEFKPVKPVDKYKCDILYIGNNIKDPQKTDRFLRIPEVKYQIYGNGFNKPISHYESLKAFCTATLNLNYGFDTSKDIITARIFQIAACKGLVMSEWTESFSRVFGDSMFFIKPNDNISLKVKEYLEIAKSEAGKEMKKDAFDIVYQNYNCFTQAKILYDAIMEQK